MAGKVYVAKESFSAVVDGAEVVVSAGTTRVREGHALLVGRADLFEELEIQYELEEATAAPGAKRGRPAKSK